MTETAGVTTHNFPAIGQIVHRLRTQAGLTLNDLARQAGISLSAVSKIENGQTSPTYDTIQRLAISLGVDVTELFGSKPKPAATGRLVVTRQGEGLDQAPHYDYQMLPAGLAAKEFTPLLTRIRARSLHEFADPQGHMGEEFIHVLKGTVILHSQHYALLRLEAGDSVYFDSSMGHALTTGGGDEARILWIAMRVTGVLAELDRARRRQDHVSGGVAQDVPPDQEGQRVGIPAAQSPHHVQMLRGGAVELRHAAPLRHRRRRGAGAQLLHHRQQQRVAGRRQQTGVEGQVRGIKVGHPALPDPVPELHGKAFQCLNVVRRGVPDDGRREPGLQHRAQFQRGLRIVIVGRVHGIPPVQVVADHPSMGQRFQRLADRGAPHTIARLQVHLLQP